MEIFVRTLDSEAEEDLRSLYHWLLEDDDIRRSSKISLSGAEPRNEEMGGALDVIQLVIENGFELANLALAYAAWRESRGSRATITIERDGSKVTLHDTDEDSVSRILKALEKD
jgi:hypothetical protein